MTDDHSLPPRLSYEQKFLLGVLAVSGKLFGPRLSVVAEYVDVETRSLRRSLWRLDDRGLVNVQSDEFLEVYLTRSGRNVVGELLRRDSDRRYSFSFDGDLDAIQDEYGF